jgi:RNA polymerase sigma-70 factor (ECF subfamily)
MLRLRSGDQAAATRVFERFADQLLALARRQFHAPLRRKIDPEDVLQSVFRSFFLRYRNGQFDLANWDNLWGLLMLMTVRKCGRRVKHFQASCRDVRREVSLDDGAIQLLARDPSPQEAAMLVELLGRVMHTLPSDQREVLSLHLQGLSVEEISARVQRTQRTVRRILERVRRRIEQLDDGDDHGASSDD